MESTALCYNRSMKTFIVIVVIVVGIVLVLRRMRRRELEAFLDADIGDFQTFQARPVEATQEKNALMARAEAYAAMNPGSVTPQPLASNDPDALNPLQAPDPNLFRPKTPAFDEITRNMFAMLSQAAGPDVQVLKDVPLTEFVGADAAAMMRLSTTRISYLLARRDGLIPLCGIELKDKQALDYLRGVFGDIGLPILVFPAKNDVSLAEIHDQLDPVLRPENADGCPKCGESMTTRRVVKGKNAGNVFRVCNQFPGCRGVLRV